MKLKFFQYQVLYKAKITKKNHGTAHSMRRRNKKEFGSDTIIEACEDK
jgi:hypothetical protein